MEDRNKFRVWSIDEKRMLTDDPKLTIGITSDGEIGIIANAYILENDYDEHSRHVYEPNLKNVIIQYSIGLQDRNKQVIYEGDILINMAGTTGTVEYLLDDDRPAFDIRDAEEDCNAIQKWIVEEYVEIIGNIYQGRKSNDEIFDEAIINTFGG